MMRAPRGRRGFRGRRLGRLRGYVGIGRWYVRRDRGKRRGCWRMHNRRRCGRTIRQKVGIERDKAEREHRPDHQEVLQDQHHSPSRRAPFYHTLGGQGARGFHLYRYADTTTASSPRKKRTGGGPRARAARRCVQALKNETPARDLSRRAYVARALAPAGTSAVGSSVANNNPHIGRNHEYSMTTVRARRVQSRPLAPDSALGSPLGNGNPTPLAARGARAKSEFRLARRSEGAGR